MLIILFLQDDCMIAQTWKAKTIEREQDWMQIEYQQLSLTLLLFCAIENRPVNEYQITGSL